MIEEAWKSLYPNEGFNFRPNISYSSRLKEYNATLQKRGSELKLKLSSSWRDVSREIVIGLIQGLIIRLFRDKHAERTLNMELYDAFIKNIPLANSLPECDARLEQVFNRVNSSYFMGAVQKPNLAWGRLSSTKLASYDFHTDTITVSSLFIDADLIVLEYLIFHELLHKKLKFTSSRLRSLHHSSRFKKLEQDFKGIAKAEQIIRMIVRKNRRVGFG
ncbi:hypothetical protein COT48_05270 [Candidatus Woesearchaeota archaeon CG08_land_8_20_14_0_20_47_9]|nr:MAG: hypothetical protein AUJ69_00830 [Candidatus Woesearchaeota archaeon CG1_02_47_18]PIN72980.1 MAG: hypothetical protein COV22_01745 [Candidatus Woesearchaeota archaeon CG10_big_fil_rev_8_21_14_0_10_47_5]PIO03345.1 MAG: hypothetical protein COT48_05270 [Candidatus Woesearchaeota archaeon CG08_land_8_20_14_0_20_47_9]HII30399.1 hypothetical protein [Candidatus Woesearchaeota archaeon]